MDRVQDLIALLKEKRKSERSHLLLWVLGIVGAIGAVAGLAYAVYRFFSPNYLGEYSEEEYEDDFNAYFEDEDQPVVAEADEAEENEEA